VKTSLDVVNSLSTAHNKVLTRPEYGARLAELAMEPLVLNREQTNAFIKREIEKWHKVATAANVKVD
jgi:tripartite-type tricarboxylate transporter receptor subunit TctC